MEGECGDERAPQSSGLRRNREMSDAREMQNAEYPEQRHQQRCDARKPHLVESTHADARKRLPAAKSGGCDQKSGDGEENLDTALAVPDERRHQLFRKPARVRHIRGKQPHVDVIHQHEQDGEAAKQIDAVQPAPAARRLCGRGHAPF